VIQTRICNIVSKYNNKDNSIPYIIAKDADLLETIFQAKEYAELGYKTHRWITNAEKYVSTKSAISIFKKMKNKNFTDWWDTLNKA
jgi:hypothetical protein